MLNEKKLKKKKSKQQRNQSNQISHIMLQIIHHCNINTLHIALTASYDLKILLLYVVFYDIKRYNHF